LKRKQTIKLFIEGGLIVFSVLFALFIDRMAGDAKTNEQKRTSLTRIHKELSENEKLIGEMIALHEVVIQSLNTAISSKEDTLRRQIMQDGYLEYKLLANGRSLFPRYPSSTAWEAAKSTGIISEFDYETIEACTGAYATQEMIVKGTLAKIIEDLFNIDYAQMDQKLIKLRLEFEEIRRQEKTLQTRLEKAITMTK